MKTNLLLGILIVLLLCIIASPVYAAETSGICGSDVDAWLDDDPATTGGDLLWNFEEASGTLTISGKGTMFWSGSAPWDSWKAQITRVVVEEGCKAIAVSAFSNCPNLTSVTLPDSLRYLNDWAFAKCKNLKQIQLPEGLLEIKQYAFRESGIQQITVPKKVTHVGTHAFMDCNDLESITFLGPPPSFGTGVFNGVTVSIYHPENPDWLAVKGTVTAGKLTWVAVPCPGHQPETLPAQEATCTQTGLTAGSRCSLCFAVLTPQEQLPKTPHSFGPWVETSAPSQWSNGLAKRYCTICNFSQSKAITSTSVLNPEIPPVTETPVTPPATEAPPATDAPEASTGTEETTAPTQAAPPPTQAAPAPTQAAPTPLEPTNPNVTEPDQEEPGPHWWVVVLIAGVVLLGAGITGMILIRGGKTVFKKT